MNPFMCVASRSLPAETFHSWAVLALATGGIAVRFSIVIMRRLGMGCALSNFPGNWPAASAVPLHLVAAPLFGVHSAFPFLPTSDCGVSSCGEPRRRGASGGLQPMSESRPKGARARETVPARTRMFIYHFKKIHS